MEAFSNGELIASAFRHYKWDGDSDSGWVITTNAWTGAYSDPIPNRPEALSQLKVWAAYEVAQKAAKQDA